VDNSVRMPPGSITTTSMPKGATSMRRQSLVVDGRLPVAIHVRLQVHVPHKTQTQAAPFCL